MSSVLLLSGGIDSAAIAAWKRPSAAITVDYGQKAAGAEIHSASQVALELGISHSTLALDCSEIGTGTMASDDTISSSSPTPEWWPFRNQFLITVAAMWAIRNGCGEVIIGTVSTDGQHADGREPFISAMRSLLDLQECSIKLSAPAAELTSMELIRISGISADVLGWTHSCHTGNYPCGRCRGCVKHLDVRDQLGVADGE